MQRFCVIPLCSPAGDRFCEIAQILVQPGSEFKATREDAGDTVGPRGVGARAGRLSLSSLACGNITPRYSGGDCPSGQAFSPGVSGDNFLLIGDDLWASGPLAKPSLQAFFPLGFAQFLAGAALQKSPPLRSSAALRP